jgi:hypothetical protein
MMNGTIFLLCILGLFYIFSGLPQHFVSRNDESILITRGVHSLRHRKECKLVRQDEAICKKALFSPLRIAFYIFIF